ncbi:MAG: hypothetical protein IPM77_16025 [Crocinitomicaceae bacterium]|nr:hypothetical protein [Crocinitomicaceae bacterium]
MKKLLFSFLTLTGFISVGQTSTSIDPRLSADKEVMIKAEENFKNDPVAYEMMVFELNNAWFVKSISEVTDSQKKQLLSIENITDKNGQPFDTSILTNPSEFNFYNYNFARSETQTVGYDLGNGQVLVFYSAEKIRAMYYHSTSKK